jgi:zona occludens toxin
MLQKWWELPPGSIVAIDECQEDGSNPDQPVALMPKDRGLPAAWVQRISKVRHHGMDFLLTTQDPCNMSAYVRRLVDKHVHTVRKFGTQVIQRYTWGRCIDDPYSRREQKNAVADVATLPSQVFDLYKSSQLHTMKRRIPVKVYLLGVAMLVALAAVIAVPVVLHRMQHKSVEAVAGGAVVKPVAGAHSEAEDVALRHADMAKWMRPRVDGVPWTAPMFDKLEVQAQPRLFCVAVDDGRCTCNTEQGTRYDVPLKMCRKIVEDGLYNPFQAPEASDVAQRDQKDVPEPAAHPAAVSPREDVASSDAWKASPMQAGYIPPELAPRPSYSPTQLR